MSNQIKEHYTKVVNDSLEARKVTIRLGGHTAICLEDALRAIETIQDYDYSTMSQTVASMIADEDRKRERSYLSSMFSLISILSRYGDDLKRARINLNKEIIKQVENA